MLPPPPPVSGINLVSAKLQSTLVHAQKKFNTSNPSSLSKKLLRKLRKGQHKLNRQFPLYKHQNNISKFGESAVPYNLLIDEKEEAIRSSISKKQNKTKCIDRQASNNYYKNNNSSSFDELNSIENQFHVEFEEVDHTNHFIEQVGQKIDCLNPSTPRKSTSSPSKPIKSSFKIQMNPKSPPSLSGTATSTTTLDQQNNNTKQVTTTNTNQNGNNNNINVVKNKTPQIPQPKVVLYPRELIKPGWRQKQPIGCGFSNLGNSCYMNATLQALFHLPSFSNWLLSDETHRVKCNENNFSYQNCLVCAMYETLKQSLNPSNQNYRPLKIHQRLRMICKHFTHGRQEDAHEFLRYLLESMERSYLSTLGALKADSRTKETTPLGHIFGGYVRTEVTCLKCESVSTTFQPLAELQLDIRHVTSVEDAVANHFKKERLENNDYKCEKCRSLSAATKQFSLEIPPIALCLQLKRFTLMGLKITKAIHCNKTLNLTRFLHKSRRQENQQEVKYRLTSLITHIGSSPNCGHYTAIAETSNSNFYQFDDSYVRPVSPHAALNIDAYVIIYERETGSCPKPNSNYGINGTSHYNNTNNNSSILNSQTSKTSTMNGNHSQLSKLLTSSSLSSNGISSKPLTNGIIRHVNPPIKSDDKPKFENPFKKKDSEKPCTATSGFSKLSSSTKTSSDGSSIKTPVTSLTNGSSKSRLVPYDAEEDSNETDRSRSKSPATPPAVSPKKISCESEQDKSPAPRSGLFPIFTKSPSVKSWNGFTSKLNLATEDDQRKREKSKEELEDEEFDLGHTKKRRLDDGSFSKSRSSSGSRDGAYVNGVERHGFNGKSPSDQYKNANGNKFQRYEDNRRRLVDKTLIPSSSSSSSSESPLKNYHKKEFMSRANSFNSNNNDDKRRDYGDKTDRYTNNASGEKRSENFNNNNNNNRGGGGGGFAKYHSGQQNFQSNHNRFNNRNRDGSRGGSYVKNFNSGFNNVRRGGSGGNNRNGGGWQNHNNHKFRYGGYNKGGNRY